jgi:hypothetical protein
VRAQVMLYDAAGHVTIMDPVEVRPLGDGFAPIERHGRIYHYDDCENEKSERPRLIFREAPSGLRLSGS